jgi:UDP-glucose:(heptosyl)LPS alpha-1,3-glucosyltransferase
MMSLPRTPLQLAFCLFKYFPQGGLQRDMLRIARACQARGHSVRIYAGLWQGPEPNDLAVTHLALSARSNHGRAWQFAQGLRQAIARSRPDGVIGFNKLPGLDLYYAADDCFAARYHMQPLARCLPRYCRYATLERGVFSPEATTTVLVLTQRLQAEYQAFYRTPPERFVLLPPNLAPERQRPPQAQVTMLRGKIRTLLEVTSEQKLLLQVGSHFHTKGLDRSLRALAALPASRLARTVLAVAGADPTTHWEHRARRLGVATQVRFLGPREDVIDLMLGADLLLQPSRRESAGIVLLEALVAGLPTLASGVCGYAFHVEAAGSGWVLTEPFRQVDFNRCLHRALEANDLEQRREKTLQYAARTPLYGMVEAAVAAIEGVVAANGRHVT